MEVAVVTGASSGIRQLMARGLMKRGFHVVARVRDVARASEFSEAIAFDAAEPASVRAAGEHVLSRHPRVALLMNNAGVHLRARETNSAGVEKGFATNVLEYHVLTRCLAPITGHIVNMASTCAGGFDVEEPFFVKRPYHATVAYKPPKKPTAC